MRLLHTVRLGALLALLPAAAAAQPVLRDVTLWNANNNTGVYGGGWWNTRGNDGTYNLFLSTVPDAQFQTSAIVNPNVTLAHQLQTGANTFWFYSSSSGSTHYGLNLFFGDAPVANNAAPDISATAGYGIPGFSDIDASVQTRGTPTAGTVGGAGTLTWTQGTFVVTLTNLQILGTASNSGIDRVDADLVRAGTGADNYGTFTLDVVNTAAPVVTPEPATWALLGTGMTLLGAVARRRRQVG
jgi:hypothetical protein